MGYRSGMNADRILKLISRGTGRGQAGRRRASNRPRGEGQGLIATFRRLTRRR
jgi:hypothetical protein